MPHAFVSVFDAAPPLQSGDALEYGVGARSVEQVVDRLERHPSTTGWAVVTGGEPLMHPDLPALIAAIRQHDLKVKVVTSGEGPHTPQDLRDLGVDIVVVASTDRTREESLRFLVGCRAISNLRATARIVLTRATTNSIQSGLPALLQAGAQEVELRRFDARVPCSAGAPDRSVLVDAIEYVVRETSRADVRLTTTALGSWPPQPDPDAERLVVHKNLLTALRDGVPMRAVGAGTRLAGLERATVVAAGLPGPDPWDLGLELASRGAPLLDAPVCFGGADAEIRSDPKVPSCERCPRIDDCGGIPALVSAAAFGPHLAWTPAPAGRVVVFNPFVSDKTLCTATLPGLALALEDLGREVDYVSAWGDIEWRGLRDIARTQGSSHTASKAAANDATPELFRHNLFGAGLVVVPGLDHLAQVLGNPTLSSSTRIAVADFHLLHGIDHLKTRFLPAGNRSMDGHWWPSENIVLNSCFPGYSHLYRLAGVPLRQVHWRPYPINERLFSTGSPVLSSAHLFAGGNQRRDWRTLLDATRRLGQRVRTTHLYTRFDAKVPAGIPLEHRGTAPLASFYEQMATSRFVVMPLTMDRHQAAGLTVIAMALAAGRPVIASRTPGTVDHLRHGVDALLVPPGDAPALANAIQRLNDDDELAVHLAEGARAAGQRLCARTWANHLVNGAPAQACWERPDGYGPWGPTSGPPAPRRPAS